MHRRGAILILVSLSLLRAEIIDRVAVTVGTNVITASEVLEEIRLTAFLNGDKPEFTADAKRKAAGRLVEQALIGREMDAGQFPAPEPSDVSQMLEDVKKQRFASEPEYRRVLTEFGLQEEDVVRHLLKQLATLRFIDLRFRPAVQIPEADLWEYYRYKLVPQWQDKGGKPPSFEEARNKVEEILKQQRVDQTLDNWIKEMRNRIRIEYHEEAFQ
jgi:hypothetical protein